ncbi:aminotransferase [candidate division KSB1 bacterium]|jgi:selenocysteine lyase/cysteine desulfurase|nr:MAG: aminotransferase [candidate division KSB1 bacterium]
MSTQSITIENVKDFIVGYDRKVPTFGGKLKRYINLDNAASTPTLKPVLDAINAFMPWYSSIHRGTGFKSQLSTHIFEQTRDVILKHCHIHDDQHVVIYGKNTTELINKVARRLNTKADEVVITTLMEHHSNDLPWRKNQKIVFVETDEHGLLKLSDLETKLKGLQGKAKLVSVTGASNVTGLLNPIHQIARLAHAYDAKILVDGAQLTPHRDIDMRPQDDPEHIDFLVMSAHKFYAPYGQGALIADKSDFMEGEPDQVGGGTIELVDKDYIYWAEPPEKEEAGTPNVVGAITMAKALQVMDAIGMDKIARHEMELTTYALKKLQQLPGITVYGPENPEDVENRLGVISLNVDGLSHAYVASILNYEYAIGVRNGCFCAHPYLKKLLNLTPEEDKALQERILNHDRSNVPGAIRMSFGMYNSKEDVDAFIEAIQRIEKGEIQAEYELNKRTGEYHPKNFDFDFEKYFKL